MLSGKSEGEQRFDKLPNLDVPFSTHTAKQATEESAGGATHVELPPPSLSTTIWGEGPGVGDDWEARAFRQQSPVMSSGASAAAGMDIVHDGEPPPAETHDRLLVASVGPQDGPTAMHAEPQMQITPCDAGADTPAAGATVTVAGSTP